MSPAKFGKVLAAVTLLCAAIGFNQSAVAAVTASIDRNKISIEDTFSLVVRSSESSLFDSPDLSALEENFEVLATRRSSQHSIVNGRAESSLEWHISLAPKRAGDLVIPPLEVNGESTKALVVEVSDAPARSERAGNDPVFLESEIDQQEVYVQAQLLLTVRIYYAVSIARGAELEDLEIADALVTKLNEASYETSLKTMRYNVHEVKYAIFPQRSGELVIPAQTFSARLSDPYDRSFFGSTRGKAVRARSQKHTIKVNPKNASFKGLHWLPAKNVSLVESWSRDTADLRVGEPITRTITVTADHLQAAQLPPLEQPDLTNAQQYPDQAETNDEPAASGVTGVRVESVAIIPSAGKLLELPEIRLPWWNTETNKQEVAIIPAKQFPLTGGTSSPPAASGSTVVAEDPTAINTTSAPVAPRPTTASASKFWVYTASLLALAWAVTLMYVIYLRQRRGTVDEKFQPRQSEAQAFAEVEQACDQRAAVNLRNALIAWARIYWSSESVSALSDISRRSNDVSLRTQLVELDHVLYSTKVTASEFDFARFRSALQAWRKAQPKQKSSKPNAQLPPLYNSGAREM